MTVVSINTRHMLHNTSIVFGIAILSFAATWATKKIAHLYFGQKNDFEKFLINLGGFSTGLAVAYSLASKATVMTFPFNKRLRGFYSLHPLFMLVFDALAFKELYEKKINNFVFLGLTGSLFGLSMFAGIDKVGSKILPLAGLLGALTAAAYDKKC